MTPHDGTGGRLRIAVVTDIHHGPAKLTKKGADALPLLHGFCDFVAAQRPDMVVDLGDRISDMDPATDARLTAEVAEVFARIELPHAHILGNHDVVHLSAADNARLLGCDVGHRSVDVAGWHLVFWQADSRLTWPDGFPRRQADLDWLRADLAATPLPVVLFSHVPLDSASMLGNYWFENNPEHATLPHAAEVREIINAAGNVVLCVAGHVHRNNLSVIDGVRYVTVQSLTESFTTQDRAAGAWALLELGDELNWRTFGADFVEMRQPLRGRNERWVPPLPSFQRLRAARQAGAGLGGVRGLLMDMDGVLYRGRTPVPGAAAAVRRLAAAGFAMACLTNNARLSPRDYAAVLHDMGLDLPAERIVTSSEAVAQLLGARTPRPTVMVLGPAALRAAVLAAGCLESPQPDVVVAGVCPELDAAQMTAAVRALLDGAELVGSNADAVLPTEAGAEPEAGPVLAFLQAASGRAPTIAGKPGRAMFDLALQRLALPREAVLVVGDTPETDIAGADAAGLRSVLVETGNPAGEAAPVPTFRYRDLAALADDLLAGVTD